MFLELVFNFTLRIRDLYFFTEEMIFWSTDKYSIVVLTNFNICNLLYQKISSIGTCLELLIPFIFILFGIIPLTDEKQCTHTCIKAFHLRKRISSNCGSVFLKKCQILNFILNVSMTFNLHCTIFIGL